VISSSTPSGISHSLDYSCKSQTNEHSDAAFVMKLILHRRETPFTKGQASAGGARFFLQNRASFSLFETFRCSGALWLWCTEAGMHQGNGLNIVCKVIQKRLMFHSFTFRSLMFNLNDRNRTKRTVEEIVEAGGLGERMRSNVPLVRIRHRLTNL